VPCAFSGLFGLTVPRRYSVSALTADLRGAFERHRPARSSPQGYSVAHPAARRPANRFPWPRSATVLPRPSNEGYSPNGGRTSPWGSLPRHSLSGLNRDSVEQESSSTGSACPKPARRCVVRHRGPTKRAQHLQSDLCRISGLPGGSAQPLFPRTGLGSSLGSSENVPDTRRCLARHRTKATPWSRPER
jgi:hypothetical protein